MIFSMWAAVAIIMMTLSGIGRIVAKPNGIAFGPLWWGWGAFALLMTLYVTVTPWPLTPFLVASVGMALFGYARNWPSKLELNAALKLLVLSLPLFWVWSHNQVFAWDDFAHRLPSYWFANKFDYLPNHSLPPNLSVWPAYPYGLTVLGVAVSRMVGEYAELALALINGTITVAFVGVIASLLSSEKKLSWQIVAAALVLMTVINPYMDREFTASAYQEASLSLATAMAFLLMRPFMISNKQRLPTTSESLAIGLTLALVVGLKQVGLIIALLMLIPFIGFLACHHKKDRSSLSLISCALVLPMLAIWLLWRWYVKANIGGGEFTFMPLQQWNWHLVPDMMSTFGEVLLKKLSVMPSLIAVSVLAFFSFKGSRIQTQRYSLLFAAFIGWAYFGFLMVTYLGTSFSQEEVKVLASFSRYMQHVNWMLWLVLILAIKDYIPYQHKAWPWVKKSAFLLILVPLLAQGHYIRKSNSEIVQMSQLALVLPTIISLKTPLAIEEPGGSGFRHYVLRYYVGYDYPILYKGSAWDQSEASQGKMAIVTLGKPSEPITLTDCSSGQCLPTQTLTLP